MQVLSSLHMISYMKAEHSDWLKVYLTGLTDPYNTLMRLCQRFAHRYDSSQFSVALGSKIYMFCSQPRILSSYPLLHEGACT